MKKFAIFLPQFHEIAENNKWWGDGFTEWTNVKSATPLFDNQVQPLHPLNNNYYNLLDKTVVEWQTSLMNNYGIDGFIYYHYYFNGKLLLEKPAENLLEWTDIPQPFFFCWANHSWLRTWNGSREVLMEQTYGIENEWEKHFQYLLKFFKDERYEKKDNKPLFMIFKSSFQEKKLIFDYFNKRCIKEGFDGIYLIESFHGEINNIQFESEMSENTSLIYYREPAVTQFALSNKRSIVEEIVYKVNRKLRYFNIVKKPEVINGDRLMKLKLAMEPLGKNVGHGIWFEWDNTPRHKNRGYIISSYKKELFFDYMNLIKDEEYLFINAWNEWCEGMILEPTEELGYKYLNWIKEWSEKQ